ncbi:MAG: hypothetical protein K6T34_05120 [Thermoflavifilum sp.]|nr:hypothetical protein [Thermoflavifilum sp.]
MKHISKGLIGLLLVGSLSTGLVIHRASATPPPRISIQVFFDALSPYGQWISYAPYGYAWVPSVEAGFIPYATAGHWVFTAWGWTWVSDYPWGWAAFHYGRWVYDDFYGWIWIPGTEWAPAWVVWAQSGNYYGWAPLPPGVHIGLSISIGNIIPYNRWVFVPGAYLCSPHPYRYYVYPYSHVTIVQHITIINQVYTSSTGPRYFYGPRPEVVERYVGRPIHPVNIADARRPEETQLEGNTLRIFRPAVQQIPNAAPRTFHSEPRPEIAVHENTRFLSPYGQETSSAPSRATAPQRSFTPNEPYSSPNPSPATRSEEPSPAERPLQVRSFRAVPVDPQPAQRNADAIPNWQAPHRSPAPERMFSQPSTPARPSYREQPRFERNFQHPVMDAPRVRNFDNPSPINQRGKEPRRQF